MKPAHLLSDCFQIKKGATEGCHISPSLSSYVVSMVDIESVESSLKTFGICAETVPKLIYKSSKTQHSEISWQNKDKYFKCQREQNNG